ncbi:ABC transporter substrate-binding protein [Acuticoccus kandeliae]|uniref:ABC transporter substrate-binding protein n=1 Tax=Acuticoccus kandeliae TaxID=2073160 RepID=UPI000D3E24B4|nr:PotD/PotF family extracellular solute-binding protein [Acuticoccus kandeliae]
MTKKSDNVTNNSKSGNGISRRSVMKGAAAAAGAAAGSGALGGFPTIWAQEIKDIELTHVGVSYSVVKAIGDQASKDLGFKVTMQNLDTSAAINRFITQPNSVDIADVEGWQAKLATKRGVLQGIERAKIKEFDNILPIFTKGEIDGVQIPRQGISPYEAMYIEDPMATDLHEGVTDWMTFLPQVYNADSMGYRPDLVGHEVTEWKELIDPKFKGKAAILDVPAIGIMDAALCFESAGMIEYGNKGNMTREEIDKTIDALIQLKRDGHFRATWTTFDQSVQLMAAGEVIIQSMWSPAVAAVRVKEVPCIYAPVNKKNGKEGYRGWCNGMALMRHLEGKKLDAAYEYLNWYLSGWQGGFVARYGYYSPVPTTAQKFLTPAEWAYWYEGAPAPEPISDPYGVPMEPVGAKRDGGSFVERVTNISCWNTLMDEAAYMNKRWNEFKVA